MRSIKFLLSLIALAAVATLGSSSARADQIVLGGSAFGSVSISCPGGMAACTVTVNAPLGSDAATTGFETPTGTQVTFGSYAFGGGPSTLQSSNGGVTFDVSGTPWTFTYSDNFGDSLTANADWNTFFNSSSFGFQVGQLDFTTISCTPGNGVIGSTFCADFGSGGMIDLTLQGISQDVASLWASEGGGTENGVTIESGSITPVPEPGTLALFGTGLLGLAGFVRRRLGK